MSVKSAYQAALQQGYQADPTQQVALNALQTCYEGITDGHKKVPGVYLWGAVGRGKTWLMDLFFQAVKAQARRQHFHHFMRFIHQRLFALTGTKEPLRVIAKELASEVRVLCFDELYVNDIGDAMLLGPLFQALFNEGVTLVATSNIAPQGLYEDGWNRQPFLPAIEALEKHCAVIHLDGAQDHRLQLATNKQRYWQEDASGMQEAFAWYGPVQTGIDRVALSAGHELSVLQCSERAVWATYESLCMQPLAAADYIQLCDRFAAIFVSKVPDLNAPAEERQIARGTEDAASAVKAGERLLKPQSLHDDGVRRFIGLVDECYDSNVPLYVQAALPLAELYREGGLLFPFQRTLSRLMEMQTERFPRN